MAVSVYLYISCCLAAEEQFGAAQKLAHDVNEQSQGKKVHRQRMPNWKRFFVWRNSFERNIPSYNFLDGVYLQDVFLV